MTNSLVVRLRDNHCHLCHEAADEVERLTKERDEYKIWWERDSTSLGKALNEVSSLRAVKDQFRAQIVQLTRDMAALQSQWDDMQQGFVEVFGEPVRDAIELLGTVERIRSGNEPSELRPPVKPNVRPKVEWTDDCQGKKDYDGPLVSVSTRYWPSGGGFHIFDSAKPELGLHQNQDGSPPSAHASIILECVRGDDDDDDDEGITLADKEFEGPTQANVQQQVEAWVQEQLEKIAGLLNVLRT